MTTETKGMEIKNKGMLLFGITLLLIGLVASFYEQVRWVEGAYGIQYRISGGYPYQTIGMVLVLAGITFVALGFFYSPRKTEQIKQTT